MYKTIPKYSWTRKFDDKEPDPSIHSPAIPPWYDIIKLLPIAYRIGNHIHHEKRNKREPIFDLNGISLRPPHPGPNAGVPLGGMGGGCIGRGFKGEFRRWSFHPGKYIHKAILADTFAIRVNRKGKIQSVVLSVMQPDEYSCLTNWNWHLSSKSGTYHAVYPRAWTVYEDPLPNIRVIIKQISPFLPNNYSDASLPVAIFEIEVENKSTTEEIDVSVLFCFQNGLDSDCAIDRQLKNFQHQSFISESLKAEEEEEEEKRGEEREYVEEERKKINSELKGSDIFSVAGVAMHHETVRTYLTITREHEEIIQSDEDIIYNNTSQSTAGEEGMNNENNLCSVLISEAINTVEKKITDKVSMAIAGKRESTNTVSYCSQFITRPQVSSKGYFDCNSGTQDYANESITADELWLEFHNTGNINDRNYAFPENVPASALNESTSRPTSERRYGAAVCIRRTIPRASAAKAPSGITTEAKPLNCGTFTFSLAWDYPLARFGNGKALPRFYTRFFGTEGTTASNLATYALWKAEAWEREIMNWQDTIYETIQNEQVVNHNLPNDSEYYYYQLFNELYFLVDGGTQWLDSCNGRSNQLIGAVSARIEDETRQFPSEDRRSSGKKTVGEEESDQHVVINLKNNRLLEQFPEVNEKSSLETKLITTEQPKTPDKVRYQSFTKRITENTISFQKILSIAKEMKLHNERARYCAGNQTIIGQFLYLEGHEYLMYNTYDVHFYASYALIMLWPQLELSLQKDFAYAVLQEDLTVRQMMGEGDYCIRKKKGAVPHDVGAPSEEPWYYCNAYNFQDVSRWKDLGSKFILQIYRNYYYLTSIAPAFTASSLSTSSLPHRSLSEQQKKQDQKHAILLIQSLKEIYPILLTVMQSMEEEFDQDKDGMIENSGFPDQTYDIWIAKGIHAYCGGLWITACEALAKIAEIVEDSIHQEYYQSLAIKARAVYLQALWNGMYLNYDNSDSDHHDSIMADMLAGQWYARACDLLPPISSGHAFSCLKVIYQHNVIAFGKGQLLGAVNGMRPEKIEIDQSCIQSREVWTGTTYGLAAAMLHEAFYQQGIKHLKESEEIEGEILVGAIGSSILSVEQQGELIEMAYTTAKGIHDAGWQKFGYWFATPEAWGSTGQYRSLGYMRALCIWSMQYARHQLLVKEVNK